MGEELYAPGTPEEEIERRAKVLVMPGDGRGKIGYAMLTNDRILFQQQKWDAGPGGGALTALVADRLQKRSEAKSGGPREIVPLANVTAVRMIRRRLRGDVYEFTLDDGSTCAVGADAAKKWNPTILRLLAERHGKAVSKDEQDSWSVS
jgi:hypothetical protein